MTSEKLLFVVQSGGFQPDVLIIAKDEFPAEWYRLLKDAAVPVKEYDIDNFLLREYEPWKMGMFKQIQTPWFGIADEISHCVQWPFDSRRVPFISTTAPIQRDEYPAPNWNKNATTRSNHGMFDPLQVYHHFKKDDMAVAISKDMEGFLFLNSYDGEMNGTAYETVNDLLDSYN